MGECRHRQATARRCRRSCGARACRGRRNGRWRSWNVGRCRARSIGGRECCCRGSRTTTGHRTSTRQFRASPRRRGSGRRASGTITRGGAGRCNKQRAGRESTICRTFHPNQPGRIGRRHQPRRASEWRSSPSCPRATGGTTSATRCGCRRRRNARGPSVQGAQSAGVLRGRQCVDRRGPQRRRIADHSGRRRDLAGLAAYARRRRGS